MVKFQIFLALVVLVTVGSSTPTTSGEIPKASYARTQLKVSRSLPGETEEVKVRTRDGGLATLIVKHRGKSIRSNHLIPTNDKESTSDESKKLTSTSTSTTTNAPTTPTLATVGYQNVDVDPWSSRVQTWTRVSGSKDEIKEPKNWVPLNREWKPLEQTTTEEIGKPSTTWLIADDTGSARSFQLIPSDDGSIEKVVRYAFLPHEPRQRTNIGANLLKNRDAKNVPPEVIVRSEINIKPQPGQPQADQQQPSPVRPKRLPPVLNPDGSITVHGKRVPDDPIDKVQVWRNARVIDDKLVTDSNVPSPTVVTSANTGLEFERFFQDVNRRYTKTSSEESKPNSYRNEVLAAEIYETGEDTFRPSIRKRMLQPEITAIYPNSRIYSPPEKQISPTITAGTRAPVLQYAHPELGVQPAKIVKSEQKRMDEISEIGRNNQYSNQQQQQNRYGEQRQKKKYVLNDKNLVDSYEYKRYVPQKFYGLRTTPPPFWYKMKENIDNGVAKVTEYAKPVIAPIFEAVNKISANVGLSRSQDVAQDKIGTVASSGSVLIPALGLVASGAALGIGAVAVGRYLDVDVLKRSNDEFLPLQGVENVDRERSLRLISELENRGMMIQKQDEDNQDVYVIVPDKTEAAVNRKKRSTEDEQLNEKKVLRKGADTIAEISEIYTPHDLRFDKTTMRDESNDVNRRRRRSVQSDDESTEFLQNLEKNEVSETNNSGSSAHLTTDWSNTPCAKRVFCEVMVKRGYDAYVLMNKKMFGLVRMMQSDAAGQVSGHFSDVMDAVKRQDCSSFFCPQVRPSGSIV